MIKTQFGFSDSWLYGDEIVEYGVTLYRFNDDINQIIKNVRHATLNNITPTYMHDNQDSIQS